MLRMGHGGLVPLEHMTGQKARPDYGDYGIAKGRRRKIRCAGTVIGIGKLKGPVMNGTGDVHAAEGANGHELKRDQRWRFWIDRGGTFTDVVALDPQGRLHTLKLLSENPEAYEDAAIEGIRRLMNTPPGAPLDFSAIAEVKMGTTVATNALLERTGERTALVITQGHADALRIGYQNRPDLFALKVRKPEVLYERVVEATERVTADGDVLIPLDEADLEEKLRALKAEGFASLAIVFLHGYRHDAHEKRAAEIARRLGFTQVSVSHEVSPLMKLVSRGDTTVVDAYLTPILRRYVNRVARALGSGEGGAGKGPRLMFMMSSGGLTSADRFAGKDAILSGPAGGVVGMVTTARLAGFERVIGFDMGGTSTDVAHFDGEYERAFETEVAGVRMRAPMLRIHTVAAGGGSILHYDGQRFRVGPDSAGADPGPRCYRRGGPLAVTDANVLLGRIQPRWFPAIFGPEGNLPLDVEAVRAGFAEIAERIGDGRTPEEVAEGFLRIAVENMANAIKRISVQRGRDVTEYLLNCFGGAGAQFACRIADALGMKTVLVHPLAGVLSAYGIGLADIRAERARSLEARLNETGLQKAKTLAEELEREVLEELAEQGVAPQEAAVVHRLHLRYEGTDTALSVLMRETVDSLRHAFEREHRRQFGFVQPEKALIIEAVEVSASGGGARVPERLEPEEAQGAPDPADKARMYVKGRWQEVPVFMREDLRPGMNIEGPALIIEPNSTIVVEPEWKARMNGYRHLLLERAVPAKRREAIGTTADPVMLEVFNNLFMAIAEQMGEALRKTASSVNIKERLDFSCAVFDAQGQLVANAPHMPVHLGSMDRSVMTIIRDNPQMKPGDVYVLNAPYNGGTHLPDVTVITPVFLNGHDRPLFYVASRGHHADIGGLAPGSMSADAKRIEEEGVLIDNFLLVENGIFREEAIRDLLTSGPWPARNPDQNIADLKAQVAANERGVRELLKMVEHFGLDVVQAYMQHVQDNAEESVRRVIDALKDGSFEYAMDNGAVIRVAIRVDRDRREAVVDFTGTSPQLSDNFNAPEPVTRAAVLYVFRCMVNDAIPLNAGCLKPIRLIIPAGSMLSPRYPAAVVAGNVETSQAVTDALFGAMKALAACQGTMNNFTFGNARHQYYETICGGAGAGPGWDGESAVHTHMTNTRLTDPEVLEFRYPVLLETFRIREGSGGAGRWRGGDGVERIIVFREDMRASLLTNRRRVCPFGLEGGAAGACGENILRRANGSEEKLSSCATVNVRAGDAIIIRTPGGGGYGRADS